MSETILATETWCQDYLHYFYEDPNTPEQLHAKLFQGTRPFLRLADTFVLKDQQKRQCDLFGVSGLILVLSFLQYLLFCFKGCH